MVKSRGRATNCPRPRAAFVLSPAPSALKGHHRLGDISVVLSYCEVIFGRLQAHREWDARAFATEKLDRLRSDRDTEVAMFWQAIAKGIEGLLLAPDPDEAMT